MFLDHIPADRRPELRERIAEFVEDLERDVPGRVVLAALVDAAKRLALKLEGEDPLQPSRRGRAS